MPGECTSCGSSCTGIVTPPYSGVIYCCCDWPCGSAAPSGCAADDTVCPGCNKIKCPVDATTYTTDCPDPGTCSCPTPPCGCPSCGGGCSCGGGGSGGSGGGGGSSGSGGGGSAFNAVSSLLSEFNAAMSAAHVTIGNVSPSTGNVSISLTPVASGPFGPSLALTYNSMAAANTIQFGYGWSDLNNPTEGGNIGETALCSGSGEVLADPSSNAPS